MALLNFKYTLTGNVPAKDKQAGSNSLVFDIKNSVIWVNGSKFDIATTLTDTIQGVEEYQTNDKEVITAALLDLNSRIIKTNDAIEDLRTELLQLKLKVAGIN